MPKLTTSERQEVRLKHAQNTSQQILSDILADLERIGKHGPDGSERDTLIVRQVCHFAAAEVHFRRHKQNLADVQENER
jgi:hypothetical protein